MRRNPEKTFVGDVGARCARLALALGVAACWMGCASSTRSNLSEYEKLVARRREAQARIQPAAQQAAVPAKPQPAAEPKPAAPARAPAKPAEKPQPAPRPAPAPAVEKPAPVEPPVAPATPEPVPAPAAELEPEPVPAPPVEVIAPPPAPPAATEPAVAPPSPPVRSTAGTGMYRLAKGDIVQVALRGIPESTLIDDSLDEYGMISLPFIHEVYAEGLTASELEQRIRQIYRDSQIYPNVTVQVMVPTRYYYMQGEIRGPGKVQMVSATRLSQAIAAAGGGTEFWSGKVQLRRNGEIYRKIKNAKRLEKYPEDDILLEPGDIVELMRSWL